MARQKQQEPPEKPQDLSIYDVSIDRALIDYVASKENLPVPDIFYASPMAHAVSLRADGWTDKEVCKGLGIGRSQLAIWQESDDLYKACIEFIKNIETDDAEQITWRNAIQDKDANSERMFALRARKPEYRDNAQVPESATVNLYVGIEGKDIVEKFRLLNTPKEIEDDLD